MAKNTNKTQATAATPVTTPVMMATAEFSQATALANQILTAIGTQLQGPLTARERQGLLKARWGSSENNRKAKFYELTKLGEHALGAESQRWARLSAAVAFVMQAS